MPLLHVALLVPLFSFIVCTLIRLRFSMKKSLLVMAVYTVALVGYQAVANRLGAPSRLVSLFLVVGSAFLVFHYLSAHRDLRYVFSYFTELSIALLCLLTGGIVGVRFPALVLPAQMALLLVCGFLTLRFLRKPMLAAMDNSPRGFGTLCLIPALLMTAYFVFALACQKTSHGPEDVVLYYGGVLKKEFLPALLLLMLFVVMVYVSLGRHFGIQQQLYEERNDRRTLTMQVSALENQCEVYNAAREKLSELRHDMRHHVALLSSLLGNGQTEEAEKVLSQLGASYEETKVRSYCLNPVVNSVLSVFAGLAEQAHTRLDFRVDFPKDVPISPLDLGVVLANALENALNACKEVEPERREISLNFRFFGDKLIFEVKNPYRGEVVFDQNDLPVAQRDGHGTGSRSIAAFAKKYQAMLDFQAADGIFIMRLLVEGLPGEPI